MSVVEHSTGPSAPPRYPASGYRDSGIAPRSSGPGDISAVDYEGFDVDEGQEEGQDVGMVQAVSVLPSDLWAFKTC